MNLHYYFLQVGVQPRQLQVQWNTVTCLYLIRGWKAKKCARGITEAIYSPWILSKPTKVSTLYNSLIAKSKYSSLPVVGVNSICILLKIWESCWSYSPPPHPHFRLKRYILQININPTSATLPVVPFGTQSYSKFQPKNLDKNWLT